MADIINLRQARKAQKRGEEENRAALNRAKHGRTKADKHRTDMEREKNKATVDGARREHTED